MAALFWLSDKAWAAIEPQRPVSRRFGNHNRVWGLTAAA